MSLEQFMTDFLNRPVSSLRAIEHRNSGNRTSMVLAREGPFQVELIQWSPNLFLPAHRHPNIEGLAHHLDGDMTFIISESEERTNYLVKRANVWKGKFYKGRTIRIGPGDWHGGKAGPGGAAFLAFQRWSGPMTAAGTDWEGPALPEVALSKICV